MKSAKYLGASVIAVCALASTAQAAPVSIADAVFAPETLRDRSLQDMLIAGAVDVRPASDFNDNYADDAGDLVFFAPGVVSNAVDIQDPRINIRGFAIGGSQHRSTALFLRDGAPLTDIHGTSSLAELAPLALARLEIERGVAELRNGGENLGGVVNFVSKRGGRDANGASSRVDGGATVDGRPGGQAHVELGGSSSALDYYASLDGVYENGWRDNNRRTAEIFHANLGFAPLERLETRFFIDAGNAETEIAGALTAADLENDAQSPTPPISLGPLFPGGPIISLLDGAREDDFDRDTQFARAANETLIRVLGHELELGGHYTRRKVDSAQNDFVGVLHEDGSEWGARLAISGDRKSFGMNSRYRVGASIARGERDVERYENIGGGAGDQLGAARQRSKSFSVFASGTLEPLRRLLVDFGTKLVSVHRETEDVLNGGVNDRKFTGVAARAGVKYDLSQAVQIWVSAERGYEAPTTDELTAGDPTRFIGLDEQDSFGFTGGIRGKLNNRIGFDVAYFDIGVENEIISIADPTNIVNDEIFDNADRTKHKGAEAAIDILLFGGGEGASSVTWRNAYQYSNFRFSDAGQIGAFDGNRLGGVPTHLYRGELRYDAAGPWFVAANLKLAGGAYYADHANTYDAPTEPVIGFSAGYRLNDRIDLFASGENLTDSAYAAGISPVSLIDPANDRIFTPGQRASVYAGMNYRF